MKPEIAKVRPAAPSSMAQSLGTIFILIHFFCVLLAFSGNVMRSALQDGLIKVLRPYLQLLNFDPDFAPFHLTRGTVEDVDHRWEVLPAGESSTDPRAWKRLPSDASKWGESLKRWQRMSKLAAMQSQDNEGVAGELARGAAQYAYYHLKIKAQQIRCRRVHEIQTWDATNEGLREFPYIANVLIDDRGHVNVARVSEKSQTAPPANAPGDSTP